MVEPYFNGAVLQLEERAKNLKAKIPTSKLSSDYRALDLTCRNIIDRSLARLRKLRTDFRYLHPRNQPERFRALKGVVEDLDFVETFGVVALVKAEKEDDNLNGLLQKITKEINYPLIPPVVTTLSQAYFHISVGLNLLMVPLLEGSHLLHLPDLYHELGHPLLVEKDNPAVQPIKDASLMALGEAMVYLDREMAKEDRGRSPDSFEYILQRWGYYWKKSWMMEFFCDLYGLFTLGPAFAWAHAHLAAKRGGDPFELRMESHPADAARMTVILYGLEIAGFTKQAAEIRAFWMRLIKAMDANAERLYYRCYPDELLKKIAQFAYQGVKEINCRIAAPDTNDAVHSILNQAWEKFWESPEDFVQWEKQAIKQLYALC